MNNNTPKSSDLSKAYSGMAMALSITYTMVGIVLLCGFIGWLVFGTLGMVGGIMLGFVIAIVHVARRAQAFSKAPKKASEADEKADDS